MAENEASPAPSSKKFPSSQEWPARVLTTKNLSVVIAGGVLIVALAKADAKDIPQIVKILVESKTFWAVGYWPLSSCY